MSKHDDSQNPLSQPADEPVLLEQKIHKVAHQLNNVLGIIRGNIEMLNVEVELSEKSQNRLDNVNVAIEKAAGLVTEIYEFETLIENQNHRKNEEISEKVSKSAKTVLIVDDEVDLVDIVARQLQFRGFKTLSATSAEDALKILERNEHIDLVFTDIVMNCGMNGLQLAKQVHQQFPDTRILLTTGHTQKLEKSQTSSDDVVEALLMAKLPKPYTHQELVSAIEELL